MRALALAILFLLPAIAVAAPSASSVQKTGNTLAITGSGFGTKATAAPNYWNGFESETIGQIPTGQLANNNEWGTTQANRSHAGARSLEWDYCTDGKILTWASGAHYYVDYRVIYNSVTYRVKNEINPTSTTPNNDATNYEVITPTTYCANGKNQEDWKRNAIDLGTGADRIYFSAWVYLDKGNSTAHSWQWKAFNVTSSDQLYYDLQSQYQPNTTSQQTNYWWYQDTPAWSNAHAYLYYWNGSATVHGEPTPPGPIGAPSDALLWGQWQRVEFYAQRSSASGVADGIWREQRIGRSTPTFDITGATNWITGNDPWRYVAFSHAIASVYTGYLDLKIYMDDIYADTTQARVEICDSATWSSRTHCEIQPPSAWSDTAITASFNQGSFTAGQTAYLYVVDASGAVSPASDPITISGGASTPALSGTISGTIH